MWQLPAPRSLLFIREKNHRKLTEKRCGRNSMTVVAISPPALGWRWPVEAVFVLRQKRDNDGRGLFAGPLPSSCGAECAGVLTSLRAALTPSLRKKKRLWV